MSDIEIRCPGCAASYEVSADALNKKGRCKRCGQSFLIKAASETCDWSGANKAGRTAPVGQDRNGLPDKVGRFEIKQRLGMGGFGTVYRAHDPQLGRDVALKVPHPHLLNRQRYLREAQVAARLRHANIVPLFEATIEGNDPYIASAFIEGQPLDAILRQRRPEIKESVGWLIKLARAVDYAHNQKIIHRDIKPANIMLDVHGEPLLMDFGLARITTSDEQLTQPDGVLGTPAYMSPEQAAGKIDELGPATDQFSLGVVLYELISGKRPFDGPSYAVIHQVINFSPPPPSDHNAKISNELNAICLRMMSKRIKDRYESLNQVADDLERYLKRGQPPTVTSTDIAALANSADLPRIDAFPQVIATTTQPEHGFGRSENESQSFEISTRGAGRPLRQPTHSRDHRKRRTLISAAIIAGVLTTLFILLRPTGWLRPTRDPAAVNDVGSLVPFANDSKSPNEGPVADAGPQASTTTRPQTLGRNPSDSSSPPNGFRPLTNTAPSDIENARVNRGADSSIPKTPTESPPAKGNIDNTPNNSTPGGSTENLSSRNISKITLRPINPTDLFTRDESKGIQDFFEFSHPTNLPSLECVYVEMPVRQGHGYSLAFSDNEAFPVLHARFATEAAFFVPDANPKAGVQELTILDPGTNEIRFIAASDSDNLKCLFKFYYDENAVAFRFALRELTLTEYP